MSFDVLSVGPVHGTVGTVAVLVAVPGGLPRIVWVGPADAGVAAADAALTVGSAAVAASVNDVSGRSLSLLPEASELWQGRPGLSGHRLDGGGWATAFETAAIDAAPDVIRVHAHDPSAGLEVRTEIESVAGGPVRVRHTLTNRGSSPYVVDGLDVVMPVPDRAREILDMTGRWGRERAPQRHAVRDGVWLRESRGGRPSHDAVTATLLGTSGFGFASGEVWAVHVGWSGNARHVVERRASGQVLLGGGELLLPGEITLGQGESYTTPWVFLVASGGGADGVAAQFHGYLRSLPAHPRGPRPVVSNVWEAVYFDHDLGRLRHLADLAAGIGVERFVLDDGWFGGRRHDRAGLGDWVVSDVAWPDGLGPLIEHVRELGMEFGLWFEPEMVNPDSELFRAHPDWILAVPGRAPALVRNQLVLDLGRPEVREYLFEQIDAVLSAYPVAYVKWDHNRDLPEAAAGDRHASPGAHAQTLGFYALLDRLRAAHPRVEWESCASGGGRIDLAVLERVERVWTSDMTDALSRQHIQRWTAQLVPPEYLGAHVSAPVNHQTGRTFSLDFRAATALFGSFGVEWDLASATERDRDRLAAWITLYKRHRELLHSGRLIRVDTSDEAVWVHGVIAPDRSEAVLAYVQLDEFVHDPEPFLVPGLDPARAYTARAVVPDGDPVVWRGEGMTLGGAALAAVGLPAPPRRPQGALVVHLLG